VEEGSNSVSLAETARYNYDVAGHMLTVQMGPIGNGGGNGTYQQTRTFVYNNLGQLTSATTPEKGTVAYTYYVNGQLYTKTDAKGQMLCYGYDDNNRLVQIVQSCTGYTQSTNTYGPHLLTLSGGTVLSSFTYDTEANSTLATNAANLIGQMVTASNNGYTWHYSYDINGHVNQQTLEVGTPGASGNLMAQAQYSYTVDQYENLSVASYPGALNPVSSVAPGPLSVYPGYDLLGRPVNLYQNVSGHWTALAATPNTASTAYSASGQLQSWTEGATNLNRTYDAQRGWMTNLTVQTQGSSSYIVNQSYAYYANGQVETATDSVSAGLTANYSYDYLNRLTAASTSTWGLAWTYDDFGNRLTQSATAGSPPTSSLTYDTTNYTNRITTSGYTYDANGNLTAFPGPQGATSVSYDAFDHAVSFTVGPSTSTVSYDAFGRRIAKTFAGGMQRVYFYDPSGRLLAEYDNLTLGGGPSRTTQYFAGQRVGQWTDRVGTKRADSGSSSQYYPYGEEITSTNNDTFRFAQTYRDSDSGLDYAQARYYASDVGRFLTPEPDPLMPAKNPQATNRYNYTLNNPVNFTDPSGQFLAEVCGAYAEGFGDVYENGIEMDPYLCATVAILPVTSAPPPPRMNCQMLAWQAGTFGLQNSGGSVGWVQPVGLGVSANNINPSQPVTWTYSQTVTEEGWYDYVNNGQTVQDPVYVVLNEADPNSFTVNNANATAVWQDAPGVPSTAPNGTPVTAFSMTFTFSLTITAHQGASSAPCTLPAAQGGGSALNWSVTMSMINGNLNSVVTPKNFGNPFWGSQ
jgi:RHS repeat-associated protein